MNPFIKSLLVNAQRNLGAAEILYDQEMYPESMFWFSQATEKANKAAHMIVETITQEESKMVGHNGLKILKKGLKNLNLGTEQINEIINLPALQGSLPEVMKADLNKASPSDFKKITLDEIRMVIASIKSIRNQIAPLFGTAEGMKSVLELAVKAGKIESEIVSQLTDEHYVKIVETLSEEPISFFKPFFTLTTIGLMTSPHSETTRYPVSSAENDITCPQSTYTTDLPLIEMQKELMVLVKEAIDYFLALEK